MFNVALRIVKDTAEAEDIMQESFITAFSKLDTFQGTATFGAWLKRIVINNSIAQYRKAQRLQIVPEENVPLEQVADETSEASNQEFTSLRAQQVKLCMDTLHDSYRNILNLHFVEGYDYEEICDIMEISYANCRTLISRAKESLRKKLTVQYA